MFSRKAEHLSMTEIITKKDYIIIVKQTLQSMRELADKDITYNILADTICYYENTIKIDGILSLEEFLEICKNLSIKE